MKQLKDSMIDMKQIKHVVCETTDWVILLIVSRAPAEEL